METLNVITRKLNDARRFLGKVMMPLWRVMPSQALYQLRLDILARYRYAFYNALITAAALDAGCTKLYSEDCGTVKRSKGYYRRPFKS